jgi:protein-L-isoaspartate(D-aspartate) O-methyltransferase
MNEMNFELARFNMVEQQVRTWDVLDPKVLDALKAIPREHYVPDEYHRLSYADTNIPLGDGQTMMKPVIEARLIQALDIQPDDKILEIGTGSGYLTALLAHLGQHVTSVEINPALQEAAAKRLSQEGIMNVRLKLGDASNGWETDAPYDVIAITGSYPVTAPDSLRQSLTIGGRMFVVTGESPVMEATLISRVGEKEWTSDILFETDILKLENVAEPQRFVL